MARPLPAGLDALARGDWDAAERLLRAAGDAPEAWEGLGWVGWWRSDEALTIDARERAYRGYRAGGDACAAARVAGWLAADHAEFRGDDAIARGWIVRAQRLLEPMPECEEHGWLALIETSELLGCGPARAIALARTAIRIGREHGVTDLEAVGLAVEGKALVASGVVADGMRRLDEAAAIAAGEDLGMPVSHGWALCCVVSACEGVGDLPRAAQWSHAMRLVAEEWGGRQMLGLCRGAYGRVLATRGDWPAAEAELEAAVGDLTAARPAMAAGSIVRLAELRVRQGRRDEARSLFARAGAHPLAALGLGRLALEEDDAAAAADAAERVLRRASDVSVLERVPALALLVRARLRLGDLDAATAANRELRHCAAVLGTPYVLADAALVEAELAEATGDLEAARRACEDAVDRFTEVAAPYDAACARAELASVLERLGRPAQAEQERASAQKVFAALGVAGAADGGRGELTARELDVLRLVAQGRSDPEIAERLVVSPHTVHRHVANVRAKLRLPSRAAAVAYAARAGLL